jgi:hypothetical protein
MTTITPEEDEEFNRIEREAVARKMAVQYALHMQKLRDEMQAGIPFITQEQIEKLAKDNP